MNFIADELDIYFWASVKKESGEFFFLFFFFVFREIWCIMIRVVCERAGAQKSNDLSILFSSRSIKVTREISSFEGRNFSPFLNFFYRHNFYKLKITNLYSEVTNC